MLIVKITVLLIVISVIYGLFIRADIKEAIIKHEYRKVAKIYYEKDIPKWYLPFAVLIILDIIGILASTVYLLFFL